MAEDYNDEDTAYAMSCALLSSFLSSVLVAARSVSAVAGGIRPGDQVKVTIGSAPIQVGDRTIARLKARTVLTVDEPEDTAMHVAIETLSSRYSRRPDEDDQPI